ncbi:VOC family protein [Psychromicrobium lacuslunae]|uniref:Glyoxalase n=1 Tax=Psychromicrobium lacuslunae TaxID=1618207 RepID=A0A0D4BXM8_9MICC|nr:VOC family protein [Psychromicrobium lacuslunae]AJT41049.1 glyoxalase [Psychromicrobium lacuslunae]
MPSRLANIVIHALQPRMLAEFWCAVLSWKVVDEEYGGVCIAPEDGRLPGIDIFPVTEPKVGHNRLHIDLRADGVSTAEELDRLLALGARRVDVGQGKDASWEVLADPEGNEFCLLSRTIQQLEAGE